MDAAADELVVGFNPMPAAERVAHYNAAVRSRAGWLVVGVVLVFVLWFWQREALGPLQTVLLFVVGLGFSIAWLIMAIVMLAVSKRSLASVGQGVALRVDRTGIEVQGNAVPWPRVGRIHTDRGPLGAGPLLVVEDTTGVDQTVPLTYLDAQPGTLDSAIRAYSGGQRWLDASGMEN